MVFKGTFIDTPWRKPDGSPAWVGRRAYEPTLRRLAQRKGVTIAEAARILGIPYATAQDAVTRLKLPITKGRPGRPRATWARGVDWRLTDAEIAAVTGKTLGTIRAIRCRVARGSIETSKQVAATARVGVRKRRNKGKKAKA